MPKHPEAQLYPSELVALGLLFALKGVWRPASFFVPLVAQETLSPPCSPICPSAPGSFSASSRRTRTGPHAFWPSPPCWAWSILYGIELIHPIREGRNPSQIGKKGKSNHRWIVGGKLCFILNQWGLICAWDCATANVHDTHFQPLIAQFVDTMIGPD